MTIYFIYETTNLINNKRYRGLHQTDDINDGYLGSGKALICAIKKYGRHNFKREILEFCESFDHLLEKEKEYVNTEWVADRNTYNLKEGGLGSTGMIPWNKGLKGAQVGWNKGLKLGAESEETRRKKSESLRKKYETEVHHSKGVTPWNKGVKGAQVAWNKGITDKKSQCPHCGKYANIGNLRRWHLDNCRTLSK